MAYLPMRFVTPRLTTRRMDVALTVIGLSGVVLVFMPFALDYVPIRDIDWDWWATPHVALVLPCIVLPPVISLCYIQRHVSGRLPDWAVSGGYFLAAISAGAFLTALFRDFDRSDGSLILVVGPFLIAFAGVAWLSIKGTNISLAVGGLVAMQCVYATLIVFALAMAITWDRFQIGAWLGAVALLAYLAQITLVLRRPVFIAAILIPLVLSGLNVTGALVDFKQRASKSSIELCVDQSSQ